METTNILPCSTETARKVAHAHFATEDLSELEEHGHDLREFAGQGYHDLISSVEDARILPVFANLICMIEGLWGVSLTVALYHMGMTTEAQKLEVLLDLCLGCEGHGVSIADSFCAELSKAEEVLGMALPPCPIFYGYDRFDALAS
jgi:hypothetical protein